MKWVQLGNFKQHLIQILELRLKDFITKCNLLLVLHLLLSPDATRRCFEKICFQQCQQMNEDWTYKLLQWFRASDIYVLCNFKFPSVFFYAHFEDQHWKSWLKWQILKKNYLEKIFPISPQKKVYLRQCLSFKESKLEMETLFLNIFWHSKPFLVQEEEEGVVSAVCVLLDIFIRSDKETILFWFAASSWSLFSSSELHSLEKILI